MSSAPSTPNVGQFEYDDHVDHLKPGRTTRAQAHQKQLEARPAFAAQKAYLHNVEEHNRHSRAKSSPPEHPGKDEDEMMPQRTGQEQRDRNRALLRQLAVASGSQQEEDEGEHDQRPSSSSITQTMPEHAEELRTELDSEIQAYQSLHRLLREEHERASQEQAAAAEAQESLRSELASESESSQTARAEGRQAVKDNESCEQRMRDHVMRAADAEARLKQELGCLRETLEAATARSGDTREEYMSALERRAMPLLAAEEELQRKLAREERICEHLRAETRRAEGDAAHERWLNEEFACKTTSTEEHEETEQTLAGRLHAVLDHLETSNERLRRELASETQAMSTESAEHDPLIQRRLASTIEYTDELKTKIQHIHENMSRSLDEALAQAREEIGSERETCRCLESKVAQCCVDNDEELKQAQLDLGNEREACRCFASEVAQTREEHEALAQARAEIGSERESCRSLASEVAQCRVDHDEALAQAQLDLGSEREACRCLASEVAQTREQHEAFAQAQQKLESEHEVHRSLVMEVAQSREESAEALAKAQLDLGSEREACRCLAVEVAQTREEHEALAQAQLKLESEREVRRSLVTEVAQTHEESTEEALLRERIVELLHELEIERGELAAARAEHQARHRAALHREHQARHRAELPREVRASWLDPHSHSPSAASSAAAASSDRGPEEVGLFGKDVDEAVGLGWSALQDIGSQALAMAGMEATPPEEIQEESDESASLRRSCRVTLHARAMSDDEVGMRPTSGDQNFVRDSVRFLFVDEGS